MGGGLHVQKAWATTLAMNEQSLNKQKEQQLESSSQNQNYSVDCYCEQKLFLVGYSSHKDCCLGKTNLLFTQMDLETTACVACLLHSCALRPGWDTDCNQTGGWELGRRHAGRQDRHLSHPLRGGKCTDITLKGTATSTQHHAPTFH